MTTEQLKQKWMESYDFVMGEDVEEKKTSEFSKMMESNTKKDFQEGEVYLGKVVNITSDFIMLDIGYKQEGLVPAREFQNYDVSLKIKMGDIRSQLP